MHYKLSIFSIKSRHTIFSLPPRCDTAYVGSCLPTFRDSLSVT